MSSSVLSLYIPVISVFTTEAYIKKIFKNKKIGKVLKVDFVKNIEKNRREAFIHFDEWFDTNEAKKLKEDVNTENKKTQFIYNETGKFWPLLVNKNPHKRVNNPKYEMLNSNNVRNVYAENISKVKFEKGTIFGKSKKPKNNNISQEVTNTYAIVAKM
tara:strand:- start:926 stop:1399 length:474 start_codon:yes stop_codon:yes gene_type:complete